jgi:hypothetical protein
MISRRRVLVFLICTGAVLTAARAVEALEGPRIVNSRVEAIGPVDEAAVL